MIIEFDGIQHFIPIKGWGGEENLKTVQENDLRKNKFCQENGVNLLRIPYTKINDIESILDEYI